MAERVIGAARLGIGLLAGSRERAEVVDDLVEHIAPVVAPPCRRPAMRSMRRAVLRAVRWCATGL